MRENIDTFVERLLKYDIISFDIFDTLLLRPFTNPRDLLRVLTPYHKMVNFYSLRCNAEKIARKKCEKENGHTEINLYDIYEYLNKTADIQIDRGMQLEIDAELSFCYANPYMLEVYKKLLNYGKKIIIVSDMYLGKEVITEILGAIGYSKYERLYVSCDYKRNKKTGKLFEFINDDYVKNKSIIHIGDNKHSDYIMPKKNGWATYYYKRTIEIDTNYDKNMSNTIGSIYNAIIKNYYNNGFLINEKQNNVDFCYGFKYSGLLVLGYVNWIHEYAKSNNMDKILFLSRDGYILKKVYDILYSDIPSEYVLWSRAATLATSPTKDLQRFIWQFITRRLELDPEIKLSQLLIDMKLSFMIDIMKKKKINVSKKLTTKDIKRVKEIIIENKELIKDNLDTFSSAAKEYYKEIIKDSKNIGIVDIGYRASGAIALNQLFLEEWKFNCKTTALISFGKIKENSFDDTLALNNDVEAYVFSDKINTNLRFNPKHSLIDTSISDILVAAAPLPSFLYFEYDKNKRIKGVYERDDASQYERVENLHEGIIAFTTEYINHTKGYEFLLNIPGNDAYEPLRSVMMEGANFKKFKKDFADYPYSFMLSGVKNKKGKNIETFGGVYNHLTKPKFNKTSVKKYLKSQYPNFFEIFKKFKNNKKGDAL